ncbi:MAG: ATP-dependent helicase [Candidatus Levybacteria bacterium]|nr:ATP-dependent helicase [Candidatus Levybacteria bacterium]
MPDEILLNDQQKAAVVHGDGPLLIIAGAGTGKTTVVTQRIKHLILEKKLRPSEILALTFTEKAAFEMETRIDEILPYGYTQTWIQTFHAFCDRVLRSEGIHIGLNPAFELMTEAEALLFLRKKLFKFNLSYFRPLGNPMKFLQGMLQHFSRLKDDDISPEQYLQYVEERGRGKGERGKQDRLHPSPLTLYADEDEVKKTTELANAFKTYEELKTQEGVMDFSDLISNTLKLFRARKNVLAEYQKKFKYIMVDEFQDTNYAQNELAILLAGENKNITVVADDDQSIYRWRGAAMSNVLQFKANFPNAKVVSLTKNYRSTQIILDNAYQLIQYNNPDRLEVQEKISKKLTAAHGISGEPVEFLYAQKSEDEAELVSSNIKQEVKKNQRNFSDFAILVRANDHALPFQRSLERAKIPYQFLGPGHLFKQEEIKDLIAYLRVLANFEDSSSLYRTLTLPIFNLEARDIAALLNAAKKNNHTLFETLEKTETLSLSEEAKEKLQLIVAMIKRHLARVPKDTAGQILYYFFEDSGLLGYYLDPKSAKTERQAQNVAKFFEKLQTYAAEHDDASVFAVVDWIELAVELGESPLVAQTDWTENNAVNILTVHSSKGLEFPVVFVVNLVTQRFPSRDRKEQIPVPDDLIREKLPEGSDENIQEERRLFYVAMTRAKDKLVLSAAKFYGEGRRERKLSPFVYEALGEEYINSLIKKQRVETPVQQLSLLEILKPVVQEKDASTSDQILHPTPYKLTYVSYSQLQTFDICPLHYKLKYILKLPSSPSPALSFGTTMHSLLKTIYQLGFPKQQIAAETISELIDKHWIPGGYESKAHEESAKSTASRVLIDYMKQNSDEKTIPSETEYSFKFPLEKYTVVGRFDRIDKKEDGKIEIIDYKTGNNMPDEKKLKNDLQLTLYALAATQIRDPLFGQQPEDILLTLYYIEKNKRISTVRTKEQLEEAKNLILQKVDAISKSEFRCSGSNLCAHCEYKMLCSTYG